MRKKIITILILAIILTIGVVFGLKNNAPQIKETEQLKRRTIIKSRLISGTIISAKEVDLVPQISGIIDEIYINTGDYVNKGDKIAKIRLITSPSNLEDAKKTLKTAQYNFTLNETKYLRNKDLFAKNMIPKTEFEQAENTWKISRQELETAKRKLEIVKNGYIKGLNETVNIVYSTIDGTVLDIPVKIGSSVTERNTFNNGTNIATIADMKNLIFTGKINEKELKYYTKGMYFDVTIAALQNRKFKTLLTNISPKGVEKNGLIDFDFKGKLLNIDTVQSIIFRSGYSGVAEIIQEKADSVLSLEEKYITFRNDSSFVYVLDGEKEIEKNILIGVSDGIYTEVKKGLLPDEKIIQKEILNLMK